MAPPGPPLPRLAGHLSAAQSIVPPPPQGVDRSSTRTPVRWSPKSSLECPVRDQRFPLAGAGVISCPHSTLSPGAPGSRTLHLVSRLALASGISFPAAEAVDAGGSSLWGHHPGRASLLAVPYLGRSPFGALRLRVWLRAQTLPLSQGFVRLRVSGFRLPAFGPRGCPLWTSMPALAGPSVVGSRPSSPLRAGAAWHTPSRK